MAERLKLSSAESVRLAVAKTKNVAPTTTESAFAKPLYEGLTAMLDGLWLALATVRAKAVADDKAMIGRRLLAVIRLPSNGRSQHFGEGWRDLAALGFQSGPKLGAALKSSRRVDASIFAGAAALLERAGSLPKDEAASRTFSMRADRLIIVSRIAVSPARLAHGRRRGGSLSASLSARVC